MSDTPQARFAGGALATVSGRFALCRGTGPEASTEQAVRPWGLRELTPAAPEAPRPARIYDPSTQLSVAVDEHGAPLAATPPPSPPTAPTTSRVDGEDPPSSEDWKNDYVQDVPWES